MGSMEFLKRSMREIARFIESSTELINQEGVEKMINLLIDTYRKNGKRKILVIGAGRSGLVGRAFAMRLMHLGYNAYVLGDTIVPRIGEDDIVIAISGSGRTKLTITAAEAAKVVKARLIALTTYPDSPLGKLADIVIIIPGRTKIARETDYFARQILGIHEPLAPLGTLFEDTCMVFLDALLVELMHRLGKKEEEIRARHANIEI